MSKPRFSREKRPKIAKTSLKLQIFWTKIWRKYKTKLSEGARLFRSQVVARMAQNMCWIHSDIYRTKCCTEETAYTQESEAKPKTIYLINQQSPPFIIQPWHFFIGSYISPALCILEVTILPLDLWCWLIPDCYAMVNICPICPPPPPLYSTL